VNLVLIGYRGSGKTTVGGLLAERLGWPMADTDKMIEHHSGCTIKEIFAAGGEAAFRDLEREAVRNACQADQSVISLGGGAILSEENLREASRRGRIVYLQASARVLWQRIQNDPRTSANRPRLTTGGYQEVVDLLDRRDPTYRDAADLIVDAMREPADIVETIVGDLGLEP